MNVMVTRPDKSGQELMELLNQQQIFAIHQPLFNIEGGSELPLLPSQLSRLNSGDYVFIVSKHAVDFAVRTLQETGFSWRNDIKYFAVGRKTAYYFSENSGQSVAYPLENENSEAVLAMPEMQKLGGKNILILRAESGRELLPETVQQRGAEVQCVECYRRVLIEGDLGSQISLAKRVGIDTIIATSGEILTVLFDQTASEDRGWLLECRLVVVSKRLANIACRLGWQKERITISAKADNQSLLAALSDN